VIILSTTGKEYDKMAKLASPPSPKAVDCIKAFLIGGAICCLGQVLTELYSLLPVERDTAKTLTSMTLIVLTAILTGLAVFPKIAKHAGAGTIVPITGFANAMVSPAMEFQSEGRILGTGSKLFTIAGPVIAYGCSSAFVYGVIAYIFKLY
jgi:stage V sporulation protein AC